MAIVTREYRGNILENEHHGRIVIVDERGDICYSLGDVQQATFYRSASKPIQALAAMVSGAVEEAGFTVEEIAMLAGSHAGEDFHLRNILSMLKKIGSDEQDLIMLPAYPARTVDRDAMIKAGLPPRKAMHNCSAKHTALMALAKKLTGSAEGYEKIDHPAEQKVLEMVAYLSEVPKKEVGLGMDGCGVPVFAVPLWGIAKAYLNLACPERISDPVVQKAAGIMFDAMHQYPLNVRGTGYLCSQINYDSNMVGKGGAMGVYGFALRKEKLGIGFKIEDGSENSWPYVIAEILRQLNYDNQETIARFEQLGARQLFNDNKDVIGEIKAVFTLEKK